MGQFFAKEPLIIGLFCGKWPMKIRHLMILRLSVKNKHTPILVQLHTYILPMLLCGDVTLEIWFKFKLAAKQHARWGSPGEISAGKAPIFQNPLGEYAPFKIRQQEPFCYRFKCACSPCLAWERRLKKTDYKGHISWGRQDLEPLVTLVTRQQASGYIPYRTVYHYEEQVF